VRKHSRRIPQVKRQPGDGKKEGAMWLGLEIAAKYHLKELRPDIELLISDTKAGKTYMPYYAEIIEKYLDRL
jgi:hypothetical protein